MNIHEDLAFRELEAGPRRDTARRFYELALDLHRELPAGDNLDACLTMLVQARDCAVRAAAEQLR